MQIKKQPFSKPAKKITENASMLFENGCYSKHQLITAISVVTILTETNRTGNTPKNSLVKKIIPQLAHVSSALSLF